MQVTQQGFSQVLTGSFGASFAQTAVVVAMYFKLRDKKMKALCPPAIISGIFGVTEPAIYGITLPKKTPFIYSMIGGAVGGLFLMVNGVTGYTMGGLGIFGIFNFITPDGDASGMWTSLIAIAISAAIGFGLTMAFWKDNTVVEEIAEGEPTMSVRKEIISSPIEGTVAPLSSAKDEAFAQGILGKGILIHPTKGEVVAPFDGTVMTLFPTKHAIGLISDNGLELLIHIGLDTVQLNGQYFEAHVKQGDRVTRGQKLITFDKDALIKAGFNIETPVLVTNSADYLDIIESDKNEVACSDDLITALV